MLKVLEDEMEAIFVREVSIGADEIGQLVGSRDVDVDAGMVLVVSRNLWENGTKDGWSVRSVERSLQDAREVVTWLVLSNAQAFVEYVQRYGAGGWHASGSVVEYQIWVLV